MYPVLSYCTCCIILYLQYVLYVVSRYRISYVDDRRLPFGHLYTAVCIQYCTRYGAYVCCIAVAITALHATVYLNLHSSHQRLRCVILILFVAEDIFIFFIDSKTPAHDQTSLCAQIRWVACGCQSAQAPRWTPHRTPLKQTARCGLS